MSVIVGRHIYGVTINPLEYLLADSGEPLRFATKADAKAFLRANGIQDFKHIVFEEAKKGE